MPWIVSDGASFLTGQTVVLDSGSTPLAMARALTVRPLTVITSSLDIAAIFAGWCASVFSPC